MIAMGQMKILFSGGYSLYVDFVPHYCHRGTGAYDENLLDDWMNKYSNVIDKRDIDNFKNTFFIQFLSLVASVGMLLIDVLQ